MTCNFGQSNYLKMLEDKKDIYKSFESKELLTWCSGCGNFGIQNALRRAFTMEGLGVKDLLMCFDIGCNGNASDKLNAYTLHGLHGRIISAAAGAALANSKLKVLAFAGDGGTMSEGPGHLIHALRNNYPMIFVLHNNENYGLTTGQASSTTRANIPMNASPDGVIPEPMNVCEFVLNCNPTFVARTFSGDYKGMTDIFRKALNHNGFAFIEVMQLCPTYNKVTSKKWFLDRIKNVKDIKNYDNTNLWEAKKAAHDIKDQISMGLLYEDKNAPNFVERLLSRKGKVNNPLTDEVKHYDISEFMKEYQ